MPPTTQASLQSTLSASTTFESWLPMDSEALRNSNCNARANKDNDYLLDRRAQKEKRAYSGVFGIAIQDASLQESMGPIQDRESEKLLPTDLAIVMARRMLHDATTALEAGVEPPALDAGKQRVR